LLRGGVAFDGMWLSIFRRDPQGLARHVGVMRRDLAERAVWFTVGNLRTEEERKQRVPLLEALAARVEGPQAMTALLEATLEHPSAEPSAALLERITTATTEAGRLAAMADYFSAVKDAGADMKVLWHALPEDLRAASLEGVLRGRLVLEAPAAMVDIALEAGRPDLLDPHAVVKAMEPYSDQRSVPREEREAWGPWALTLPAVPEMDAICRGAVEGYLTVADDEGQLRDWVQAIPSAWHRDRVLAVMAEQAAGNDPEAVKWALERIGDPEVKARVRTGR
jgi:hypothetical protein